MAGSRILRQANVSPLDLSGMRTVTVGTGLWLLAVVVLLPFTDQLEASDRLWWLFTCAVGAAMGIPGMAYCRRRQRLLHPSEVASDEASDQPPPDSGEKAQNSSTSS